MMTPDEKQDITRQYLAAQDAMKASVVALASQLTLVAETIEGSQSPLDTGLKLQAAGRAMHEMGTQMIKWHDAVDLRLGLRKEL
jgi:hypothetical protein